jgi:hypothetical protein
MQVGIKADSNVILGTDQTLLLLLTLRLLHHVLYLGQQEG